VPRERACLKLEVISLLTKKTCVAEWGQKKRYCEGKSNAQVSFPLKLSNNNIILMNNLAHL
jgi:hypothetical protein